MVNSKNKIQALGMKPCEPHGGMYRTHETKQGAPKVTKRELGVTNSSGMFVTASATVTYDIVPSQSYTGLDISAFLFFSLGFCGLSCVGAQR